MTKRKRKTKRRGKRYGTLWGGTTKIRNITWQHKKGKQKYGVFFKSATVPFLVTTNLLVAKQLAEDLGQSYKVRKYR